MNPLGWKREHQVAGMVAAGAGALIGLVIAVITLPAYDSFRWGELWCQSYSCVYLLTGFRLRVAGWIVLGAGIGAALVYVRQLLRV